MALDTSRPLTCARPRSDPGPGTGPGWAGLLLACGLACGACAVTRTLATPYLPRTTTLGDGYAEEHLRDRIWRVSFRASTVTAAQTVRDFTLLRACEVALRNGWPYFRVLTEGSTFASQDGRAPVVTAPRFGDASAGPQSAERPAHQHSLLIEGLPERPRALTAQLHEAAAVRAELAHRHGLRGISRLYQPSPCRVEAPGAVRRWTLIAGSGCDPKWGFASGPGEAESDDGHLYRGSFWRGQMHGHGRYSFPDGRIYEGDFDQGQMTGTGEMSYPDGWSQRGRWEDGRLVEAQREP